MMTSSPKDIWKAFKVEDQSFLKWRIGAICLHAGRLGNDWLLATTHEEATDDVSIETNAPALDKNQPHHRWALKSAKSFIRFTPAMPDRPLVVRPLHPLGIPPESEVQFYIHIPAWVRCAVEAGKSSVDIACFPSETLSNTWFGDTLSGVFCYASKSAIGRDKTELAAIPNQVICPFKINNKGSELFHLERICLRVKYLSIYAGNQRLWSNGVTATYRGHGRESQIVYQRTAPKEAHSPELITRAEEKPEGGFFRHTFNHHSFPWKKDAT